MSFDLKKNLKLLVPRYGLNDNTTKRISVLAVVIPFLFGGLALWFSYSKVTFSERKYGDLFERLKATKSEYAKLQEELNNSQGKFSMYEERLQKETSEYHKVRDRLRDSMDLQKKNILGLRSVFYDMHENYSKLQDSSKFLSELVASNTRLVEISHKNLKRLNDSIQFLKSSLQDSHDSLQVAKADVEMMKMSIEGMAGKAAKIKPIVRSRTLFGHKDNHDRQLFEFAIWLNIPKDLRNQVSNVTYKFNLPEEEGNSQNSGVQSVTSTDASNDFRTTYTAWGCVKNMIIQVKFKGNFSTPIFFDLCSSLNNPLIEELPNR